MAGQVDGSLSPGYAKNGPNDGPNLLGFNISGAFASQLIDPTNHRLYASDPTNHRVLVFNLDTNNQLLDHTPDAVLGQTDFYSRTAAAAQNRFNSPRGLALDTTTNRLFVADYSNSRVLVFDVATITNGENAINVLGQTTFTASSGATAQNRLKNPAGVALDAARKWLFVGDYNNNRVMVFDVTSITNGQNAINVLGQANFTTATAATTQSGLRYPTGVTVDGGSGRLFVADTNNHRVILFDVATITNGENAVNVLGQPDFVTATAATTQAGMRNPQGVALDPASSLLFVADTNNHRVTVFDVASVTNGENAVNVLGQANFTGGSSATTQSRMSSPIGVLPVATATAATTTIAYGYDPLYRLKAADYNTGPFFHYTYDATGNRLTQVTQAGTNNYVYDNANRLTSVDGVTYSWNNNGDLLSDGISTYTYDHANRLATATQGSSNYVFAYNGQGNRLRQTVNGTPINYTVDINTDLAVVLADGTNSYLYGPVVGSVQGSGIGEKQAAGWRYHLGDALASVRQLVDPAGDVKLAQSYAPFGSVLSSAGSGSTVFGFTGEQRDATGLMYLRARYLSSDTGRFISRDTWTGRGDTPMSHNGWLYGYADPVDHTDPSGRKPCADVDSRGQCIVDPEWRCEPCALLDRVPSSPRNLPMGTPSQRAYSRLVLTPMDYSKVDPVSCSGRLAPWWRTERFESKRPVEMTAEMLLGVMIYMEVGSLHGRNQEALDVATELLARRYWYWCNEMGGCRLNRSVLDYPSGLHRTLSWSQSFMGLAGQTDLTKSDLYNPQHGDPGWAYQMGNRIINQPGQAWKKQGQEEWSNHPWTAFNPQSQDEQRYFRSVHTHNFDTSREGVYYWVDGRTTWDWVAITRSQQIYHCEGKGMACGSSQH